MFIRSFLKHKDTSYLVVWFLCLLVPLSFFYHSYEKFETIKWVIWLLLTGGLGFYLAKTRQWHIRPFGLIGRVIGVMLGLGLISAILAPQFWTAMFGTYPRFTNGWGFYVVWAMWLWGLLTKFKKTELDELVKLLMFVGGLIALLGILQSVWGVAFYEGVDRSVFARAPSFLGNPNFSSMFLASLFPLVYAQCYQAKKWGLKIYYGFLLAIYVFGILTFSSRGAWLALLAGLVVFLLLLGYYRLGVKLMAGCVGLMMLVLTIFFSQSNLVRPETLKQTINLTESNLNSRLLAWDLARQGIADHPWFGVGLGNFQIYFEQHRHSALADHNGVYDDVHNLWLQQAVSGGLGFGLSFLFLCLYAFKLLYEQFKSRVELTDVGLTAGLVAWMVAAAFNPVALPNFLLLAVLLAGGLVYQPILPAKPQPVMNWQWVTVYYIVSGVLVIWAVSLLVGEISLFFGLKAFNQQRYALAKKYFQVGQASFMNRLSESYLTATHIILQPREDYTAKIEQVGKRESHDANTFATQAKLYYLWFISGKNSWALEQAIAKMRSAIAVDVNYPQRYFRLGYYLAESGQLETARETVKIGLQLYGKDVAGWVLLARIYQLEHKLPQTRFALNKAYELQPLLPELRFLQRFIKANPLNFEQYIIPAQIDSLDFR